MQDGALGDVEIAQTLCVPRSGAYNHSWSNPGLGQRENEAFGNTSAPYYYNIHGAKVRVY